MLLSFFQIIWETVSLFFNYFVLFCVCVITSGNIGSSACCDLETDQLWFIGYFTEFWFGPRMLKYCHYFILPLAVSASCLYHKFWSCSLSFLGSFEGSQLTYLCSFLLKTFYEFLSKSLLKFLGFHCIQRHLLCSVNFVCCFLYTKKKVSYKSCQAQWSAISVGSS